MDRYEYLQDSVDHRLMDDSELKVVERRDRGMTVVTQSASCFYHAPLYEGEVVAEAFFNKRGKVNDNVEVHFFQKDKLCFQAIFSMHATGVVLNEVGEDEA